MRLIAVGDRAGDTPDFAVIECQISDAKAPQIKEGESIKSEAAGAGNKPRKHRHAIDQRCAKSDPYSRCTTRLGDCDRALQIEGWSGCIARLVLVVF